VPHFRSVLDFQGFVLDGSALLKSGKESSSCTTVFAAIPTAVDGGDSTVLTVSEEEIAIALTAAIAHTVHGTNEYMALY
jgi:hypothetical protein